jgi:hypothetical protein
MQEPVRVFDLFVNCSFPKRPDVLAASDTCQDQATSAVEMANGDLMWRCPRHRGFRGDGTSGNVYVTVPREISG